MTKTCFQALLDKYGEKICGVHLDNGRIIYVGYRQRDMNGDMLPEDERGVTIKDLSLETIGDSDCLVIKNKVKTQGSIFLDMISIHPIDNVQCVSICDTPGYLLDPAIMN